MVRNGGRPINADHVTYIGHVLKSVGISRQIRPLAIRDVWYDYIGIKI